jgi:hypothetical protein
MNKQNLTNKRREWLRRYIPAEIIGTTTALLGAWIAYTTTGSYVVAAASGWVGEGIGFFGYFVTLELLRSHKQYSEHSLWKRVSLTIAAAGTNLIVEFLPAEIIDNFVIRPFAMYIVPMYLHPYPLGFLIGKFSADIIFYAIAIGGYETRKRLLRR